MTDFDGWTTLKDQVPPRKADRQLQDIVLRGQKQFKAGLVVGSLLCSVMFLAFFPWPIFDEVRLGLTGLPSRAVVIDSYYGNRTIGDNIFMRKQHMFVVRFRFSDKRGQEHTSYCLHAGYIAPNTKVEIFFSPERPKLACLAGGTFVPGGGLELVFGLIFIVLPLVGLWNYRNWRNTRLRLLSHGQFVQGTVEQIWCHDPKVDPRGWIDVEYQTRNGKVRQTHVVEKARLEIARGIFEQGSNLSILYDDCSPRNHIVLEFV